jgi:hypothetical protein
MSLDPEALRSLIQQWRQSASWKGSAGPSEKSDAISQCADELEAVLARSVEPSQECNIPQQIARAVRDEIQKQARIPQCPLEPSPDKNTGHVETSLVTHPNCQWRPIETAPTDGTRVLIFAQAWDSPVLASFQETCWRYYDECYEGDDAPTHWLPFMLPASQEPRS